MRDKASAGQRPPYPPLRTLLLVAGAAALVYILLPGHPLLGDANLAVTVNHVVQEPTLEKIFTLDFWGFPLDASYGTRSYRPLVTLTYVVQAHAGPLVEWLSGIARVLHLTDLLLHAGMAVLVALLAALLMPGSRWSPAAGFLFAVHPLATEAVCSIVGRADMLAAGFMLLALIVHLRASWSRWPWVLEGVVALCVGAAMLCKEYAVAFPFILVAVDAARLWNGSLYGKRRQAAMLAWGGSFAFLVAYLAVRYALIGELGGVPMIGPGDQPLATEPLDVRWGTAAALLLTSGRLLVAPYALNYFYCAGTVSIADGLLDPAAIGGMLFTLVIIGAAAWLAIRRGQVVPVLAAALFLLPLGPSLNTVSVAGVLFAERFMYLPLAGFSILVAWIVSRVARTEKAGRIARVALIAVCAVAGALTMHRVSEWESSKSLVLSAIEWYPESSCAQYRLGLAMRDEGRPEEALACFETSLRTEPRSSRAWKEYADALITVGRYEEGAAAMRHLVQMAPKDLGPLWQSLGEAELRAGNPEAGVRALQRAVDLMPGKQRPLELLSQSRLRLAQQRLVEQRPAEAARLVFEAVAASDIPGEGLYLAGLILTRAGERRAAMEMFDRALDKDPDLLRKKHRLAVELDARGEHARAASLFEEILAARPTHAHTLFNLGRSLVLAGQPDQAIPALTTGLRLEDDPDARQWLARAREEATR